jgi:integrase
MASIFKNGNLWWIKVRGPVDGVSRRLSLGTSSRPEAQLLLRKWDATVELLQPEYGAVALPASLTGLLPAPPSTLLVPSPGTITMEVPPAGPALPPLAKVIREYADYCRSENAAHHAANKEGILKAAFGPNCLAEVPKLEGPLAVQALKDLSCGTVEAFINARQNRRGEPITRKTKHHYRELFVQLFNFALRRSYYLPTNIAFPNPMGALPGWNHQSEEIVFLQDGDVERQFKAVAGHGVLHACVATLIHAGPRRNEALWLRRESLRTSPQGGRYLSIRTIRDESTDKKGSLKTSGSARSVPLCPDLAAILDQHLTTHSSPWLFPAPRGGRWDKDHFSKALALVNAAAGLPWTAGHYRHTYATRLASSGYSVFALAKQMGTSIQMIMVHYAAFFPPEAVR